MKLTVVTVILVCLGVLCSKVESRYIGECMESEKKCSRWNIWGPNLEWKTCDGRCKQLAFDMGVCERSPVNCPLTTHPFQCHCY